MKKDGVKINFLSTDAERKARRTTIVAAGLFTLCVGLISAIGAGASFRAATHGTTVLGEVGHILALADITHLTWGGADTNDPFATPDSRINILLLGVGGDGHDGAQLTDTIILASLDRTNKKIGLVSIPRDLAYPLGGGRFEKINAVNAYAEQDHPGEGATDTAKAFEKLFNTRIDRVIKIDFAGFTEFVDALGGLDINVEHTFTDYQFPTEDTGPDAHEWQTVSFTQGTQHMDGVHALMFARSRHGNNGEGSDFARSRRQQIVIDAIRTKLLSLGTLSNPGKLTKLWTAISSHLQTNLSAWDMLKLAPLGLNFSEATITSNVLTDANDGELIATSVEGSYMLFPKKPDWSDVRNIIADPFETKEEIAQHNRPTEPINVEIRNGTTHTGFASQIADKLRAVGYTVGSTGNAIQRGYERTVIYDLTNGQKPTELSYLRKLLDANVASSPSSSQGILTDSGTRETLTGSSTHFLIILGDSSLGLVNPYYAGTQTP